MLKLGGQIIKGVMAHDEELELYAMDWGVSGDVFTRQ